MDLNLGFVVCPGEVIGLGLHDCGTAGGERLGLLRIKLVSGPHVEGARYHCHMLDRRMPVGRKLVVGGKLQEFFNFTPGLTGC